MITVKQVDPESQMNSWLVNADGYLASGTIAIFGNRDFKSYVPYKIQELQYFLDNYIDDYDSMDELRENISYFFEDEKRILDLPDDKILEIKDINEQTTGKESKADICKLLDLIYGEKWDYTTMRGYCQGDWQEILYAEAEKPYLKYIEADYMGMSDQWEPEDGPYEGTLIFTYEWKDEEIRKEIADSLGVKPEEIILKKFTGYSQIPNYTEI
jgi:hypothetical protein